jgi:3-keto-5-aminohexanoate cleavage enzyme
MESYCVLLEGVSSNPFWMVAGLRADIKPLYKACLRRGGHLRVGLEDAAFQSPIGNADLTQNAVDVINRSGRIVGTAPQLRQRLASSG